MADAGGLALDAEQEFDIRENGRDEDARRVHLQKAFSILTFLPNWENVGIIQVS